VGCRPSPKGKNLKKTQENSSLLSKNQLSKN
jgi:hypothetical protein